MNAPDRQPFTPTWVALVFEGPAGLRAYRGRVLAGELEAVLVGRRKTGFVQLEDAYWLLDEGQHLEPLRGATELPEALGAILVPVEQIRSVVPLREEVVEQLLVKFAFAEVATQPPPRLDEEPWRQEGEGVE